MMHMRRAKLILLSIVALSIALRLYQLDAKPVWFDETVSICHSEKPISAYLFSPRINYKPVYFFLLNIWIRTFGEDPHALRLFSVIFGVLSVLLIYRIGKILFGARIGLISAYLLSISVFHIFQSQQIRHFSLLVFLMMGSLYCFVRCIRGGALLWFAGLAITTILTMFTHPYGLSVILIEILFLFVARHGVFQKKWVFAMAAVLVFLAAWLALPNKTGIKEMTWWITTPGAGDVFEALTTLSFGGSRYGLSDFRIWGGGDFWMPEMPWHKTVFSFSLLLLSLYLFLGYKGVVVKPSGNMEKKSLLLILLWFLVPITAALIVSWTNYMHVFAVKHLIIVLPAFLIIVARGIDRYGQKTRNSLLAIILLLHVLPLSVMFNNFFCTDWKAGGGLVRSQGTSGDLVVVYPLMEIVPFLYYYENRPRALADIDIYGKESGRGYDPAFFVEDKGTTISGIKQGSFGDSAITFERDFLHRAEKDGFISRKTAWVMISRWTDPQDIRLMLGYFGEHFKSKEYWQFQGLRVYRFSH